MQRVSRNTAGIAAVSIVVLVGSSPIFAWLFGAESKRAELAALLVPFILAGCAAAITSAVLYVANRNKAEREIYACFGTSVALAAITIIGCLLVPHLELAPSNKICGVLFIAALLGFVYAGFKESAARLRDLTGGSVFFQRNIRSD